MIRFKYRLDKTSLIIFLAGLGMAAMLGGPILSSDPAAAEQKLADQIKDKTPRQQVQYLTDQREAGRDDPEVNFFLGVAMYSMGKLDSALVFFSNAVSKDSTYTKAYVNLGIVMDAMRKPLEAEGMYKRAIALDPTDELALCHLGFLYYSQRQREKAMDYYQQALSINPKSAQAHYNLGLAFAEAKIFKEAIFEWEQVVEEDPEGVLGKTAADNIRLIKQYLEVDAK